MKENIKENKKTNTKAQNDLSLLFKYRKFLMGFAALWILMTHEWQIVTNETSILPDLLKGGDKLMANVKLLIIVSICGLALYLINKAIVWILDLIDRLTSNIGKNKMVDN